jgi:hypothetical protein
MYKKNFGHIKLDEFEKANLELEVVILEQEKLENKVNNLIKSSICEILSKYRILPHDTPSFQGKMEDYLFYTLTNNAIGYDVIIYTREPWNFNDEVRTATSKQYGIFFAHCIDSFKEFLINLESLCKEIRK